MDVNLKQICCVQCGIVFWVTASHYAHLLRCHNTFYCPNGHANYFSGKNETEEQKERAEKAESQAHRLNCELEDQIEMSGHLQRSNNSLRGAITRIKKTKTKT